METVRDLGEVDLWQESLQRSLARRGRLPRSSPELARLRPARDISDEEFMSEYAQYWRMRREAVSRRPLMPAVGMGGISTLVLLAATLPNLLGGRSASARSARIAYVDHAARPLRPMVDARRLAALGRVSHRILRPRPVPQTSQRVVATAPAHLRPAPPAKPAGPAEPRPAPVRHRARPTAVAAVARTAKTTRPRRAPATRAPSRAANAAPPPAATPTVASGGYVNPLARASVTPERIDQGVDYGASGTITAIGAGTITYVETSGTGWPGAFVEFRLSGGPDAGRYVYYAEGIAPVQGLHVGQTVNAGQAIGTLSDEIEIGWGAGVGTETYAMQSGQWKPGMDGDNAPTAAGKSFSALIASVGGPPGKIEG